jgi:hypothetical protein
MSSRYPDARKRGSCIVAHVACDRTGVLSQSREATISSTEQKTLAQRRVERNLVESIR